MDPTSVSNALMGNNPLNQAMLMQAQQAAQNPYQVPGQMQNQNASGMLGQQPPGVQPQMPSYIGGM